MPTELVAARTPESFIERSKQRVSDTVVATVDETVAGFVIVVGDEVEQVYVAAEHRGSGVSPALLDEAERLVAVNGFDLAWLAVATGNTRARAFYARRGWRDDGAFDYGAAGGVVVPCHRYVKRVGATSG